LRISGALTLLVALAIAQPVAGGIEVRLSPKNTYVAPAQLCTLDVWVESTDPDSLACMQSFITWDMSLVTLLSVEEGPLFVNAPYQTFFYTNPFAPDSVQTENCVLGYQAWFPPPGSLVRYIFQADNVGAAAVQLYEFHLLDIDRVEIFPTIDPDAVIYIGMSTPAETPSEPQAALSSYPNPFNPSTTVSLQIPEQWLSRSVTIAVYSPSGRRIKTLYQGEAKSQQLRFAWNGTSESGGRVASGVYLGVAHIGAETITTKLVLIE